MAWRPNELLMEGILDNTTNGKVTGWMKFAGMDENVKYDLEGNFHRDIRGAKIRLRGDGESANPEEAAKYMEGFAVKQTGKVGDMTAGREPADYVDYPYFEHYGDANGRVVLELEPDQVELLTQPIPACESDPVSRKDQAQNMAGFLSGLADNMNISQENAIAITGTRQVEKAKKVIANDKIRGMKLLPDEIRQQLPALGAQDGKGGKAVVYCKMFTPDSGFTWWMLEGSDIKDEKGSIVDYHFFALVDGHAKEFGYVSLNELEELTGPMGLPVERDLYFKPQPIDQIAPEMFKEL